jgi:hypothetical protein
MEGKGVPARKIFPLFYSPFKHHPDSRRSGNVSGGKGTYVSSLQEVPFGTVLDPHRTGKMTPHAVGLALSFALSPPGIRLSPAPQANLQGKQGGIMKRIPIFLTMAILSLSACENGSITSPESPEIAAPAFSKPGLALFAPPQECPEGSCPLGPVILTRETKAPTVLTESFPGTDGQTGTLVVLASDPKTTTVKAWLNGNVVLLPSDLPRSGSDEVRVPVTLLADNVLEVRLSAKPGTQVAIWVQTDAAPPSDSEGPPPPAFRITSVSYGPTDDLSGACTAFGDGFHFADWTDVVQAVTDGTPKADISSAPLAFILNNGSGHFQTGFPSFEDRHYALASLGSDPFTVDSVEPEMFWLTSTTSSQPVLCAGPAS